MVEVEQLKWQWMPVGRTQAGVRAEKSRTTFDPASLAVLERLKKIHGLDRGAADANRLSLKV